MTRCQQIRFHFEYAQRSEEKNNKIRLPSTCCCSMNIANFRTVVNLFLAIWWRWCQHYFNKSRTSAWLWLDETGFVFDPANKIPHSRKWRQVTHGNFIDRLLICLCIRFWQNQSDFDRSTTEPRCRIKLNRIALGIDCVDRRKIDFVSIRNGLSLPSFRRWASVVGMLFLVAELVWVAQSNNEFTCRVRGSGVSRVLENIKIGCSGAHKLSSTY